MMIKMRKGYQYAIAPIQQQAQKIEQNIGCARFIYNKLLEDKIKYYEMNKKSIRLTPAPYKAEYPFLKDADSMALTNAADKFRNCIQIVTRMPDKQRYWLRLFSKRTVCR